MEDQFNDELRQAAMRIKRRNMIGIGTAVILSAATLPLLLDEDKEEQKFEFGQAGGEAPKNPNKSQTDNDSASGTYLESRYQRHDTDLQAGAIRHQFASTVRVIDANTGRLIEGAQVLLAATAEAASHAEGATAYTDQQGSTVLRTVDNPRTQWLLVTHPKYQCVLRPPQDAEASHEPGPNESIAFDVRLTAALQLTVNVMDTTDRPLAGVEVYAMTRFGLESDAKRRGGSPWLSRAKSDQSGSVKLSLNSAGQYRLVARSPLHLPFEQEIEVSTSELSLSTLQRKVQLQELWVGAIKITGAKQQSRYWHCRLTELLEHPLCAPYVLPNPVQIDYTRLRQALSSQLKINDASVQFVVALPNPRDRAKFDPAQRVYSVPVRIEPPFGVSSPRFESTTTIQMVPATELTPAHLSQRLCTVPGVEFATLQSRLIPYHEQLSPDADKNAQRLQRIFLRAAGTDHQQAVFWPVRGVGIYRPWTILKKPGNYEVVGETVSGKLHIIKSLSLRAGKLTNIELQAPAPFKITQLPIVISDELGRRLLHWNAKLKSKGERPYSSTLKTPLHTLAILPSGLPGILSVSAPGFAEGRIQLTPSTTELKLTLKKL